MTKAARALARRILARLAVAFASCAGGLACVAAAAGATTYYVRPGGNDGAAGTSAGAAWATLRRANDALEPGDLCRILPGRYEDPIRPRRDGRRGRRIRYLGDAAAPERVTVPQIELARAFITVRGVTSSRSASLQYDGPTEAARFDSVTRCVIGGVDFVGAKDCVVADNVIRGTVNFLMDHWAVYGPDHVNSERDTLRGNRIDVGVVKSKAFIVRGSTQRCLIESNRISARFSGSDADVYGRYLYNSYDNVFRGNRWTFEADHESPNGNPWVAFALRDSSSRNLFDRDTMWCGVESGFAIGGRLVNAGNEAWVGRSTNNTWRRCFYKTTSFIWAQDAFLGSTIEQSVFVSRDSYPLYLTQRVKGSTIRRNTFHSGSSVAMWIDGDTRDGGNLITGNIFSSNADPGEQDPVVRFKHADGYQSDRNLFHARSAGARPASSYAISVAGHRKAPGSGSIRSLLSSQDRASRFGSPEFVNTSFERFDPRLKRSSRAFQAGKATPWAGAYGAAAGR